MSKKKRLGRGLEALLGVGSGAGNKNDDQANESDSAENNASAPSTDGGQKPGGIDLGQKGMEITSIEEIATPPQAEPSSPTNPASSETEEPTILKFQPTTKPVGSAPNAGTRQLASTPSLTGETPPSTSATNLSAGNLGAGKPTASNQASQGLDAGLDKGQADSGIVELNVYDVDDNPFQPRREFNKTEIESLAESLKTHEQLQPILVRKVGGRFQLISGERRLRAAIHAGWSKIRAQVREADDRLVAELAIVENLQRKDLNPVEKALSFRRYIDEHGCSQEDLAGRLKIDRSTVANLLRLLELPDVVQKAIQVGIISNGHARALLPLGEEHLQIEFCNRIQREGLSVRAIEQLVRDKIDEEDGVKRKTASKGRTKSSQVMSLESELRNALGTKVEIKASSRGRGKIVVHYLSRDEFERLRQLFGDSGGQSQRDAA